jgi:hypothetical protein
MLAVKPPKSLIEESEHAYRRLGDDRGRPLSRQEQADLAAEVARLQRCDDRAVLLDSRSPLEDREELVREVAWLTRSPACTSTSSNSSASARFVDPGSAARLGTESIRTGSTTARRYCACRPRYRRNHSLTRHLPHGGN